MLGTPIRFARLLRPMRAALLVVTLAGSGVASAVTPCDGEFAAARAAQRSDFAHAVARHIIVVDVALGAAFCGVFHAVQSLFVALAAQSHNR